MSVLQRKELEQSPLADLHAIASELGIERFRVLRQAELVTAIVDAQGGEGEAPAEADAEAEGEPPSVAPDADDEPASEEEPAAEPEPPAEPEPAAEPVVGMLDVLQGGSGFLRVESGDDVYVSPAQIRRCELRPGDEVSGPPRPARRNERHPSLVRVEKVNGRDAEPPEERPLFSDLTPVHPTERLPAPDALKDVPYGKGSRVAVSGAPGAGSTRILAEIIESIAKVDGLTVSLVLVGARPEELTGWHGPDVPVTGGGFDGPIDAQVQAAELAVERGKRAVERGGDAVVVVDSLIAFPPAAARRLFGAARKAEEGGSLTVIAATGGSEDALRQANTRIVLEQPSGDGSLHVVAALSGAQRPDLLA